MILVNSVVMVSRSSWDRFVPLTRAVNPSVVYVLSSIVRIYLLVFSIRALFPCKFLTNSLRNSSEARFSLLTAFFTKLFFKVRTASSLIW